jgi:peptide/nickel transport system permease protein
MSLQNFGRDHEGGPKAPEDASLVERIQANPRPALAWGSVMAVLVSLQLGSLLSGTFVLLRTLSVAVTAIVEVILETFNGPLGGLLDGPIAWVGEGGTAADPSLQYLLVRNTEALRDAARGLPTLLSRDLIPNQGHMTAAASPWSGPWEGTFMGLPAHQAWLIRVVLVYLYAAVTIYWMVRGYFVFRRHYRKADWTPRDDIVERLRNHRWGQFGMVVIAAFLVLVLFAPTLSPTTKDQNLISPYEYEVEYYDGKTGGIPEGTTYADPAIYDDNTGVETAAPGKMNLFSRSSGDQQNTGLWSYDDYQRFHPFGTLTNGKDLFTFVAFGARISFFIGLVSIGVGGFIATSLALLSAYYKGLVDLITVLAADTVQSIPFLLLIILIGVTFQSHWIAKVYNKSLLLSLVFAFGYWPGLWRAVRGPAFQVSEREWIDAAKSFGQPVRITLKKHMLPYILGYLLIYGSMTMGGIIIATSALSFLGLGITTPTPEWGRAISMGESQVNTAAWHVPTIPGVLIVTVVTAFNALGDGIRDAIDPKSEGGDEGATATTGGGA